MKLKSLLSKLTGLITLSVGLSAFAGPGVSFAPISYSFINNGTYVAISNNVNWTFDAASNVWFAPFNQFTNVYSGTTNGNANLNIWPPAFVDVPVPPNGYGEASGNLTISGLVGLTNNFFAFAGNYFSTNAGPLAANVMSPVIRNLINSNNIVSAIGQGSNTLTFTFAPVHEPYGISMTSGSPYGDKTFVFAVPCTNGTAVTAFSTNVPTTFTQGATKIRLIKIAIDNQTSPGAVIDALTLQGWAP